MTFSKAIFGIALLLTTACCTGRLREDPSAPAIEANYMTAEIISCGKRSLGLSVCSAPILSDVSLKVQGIYRGQMRAVSTGCAFDETVTYGLNELVEFKFKLINKRCLVTVSIAPDYPKKWRNAVVVHGLRGVAAFRATEGTQFASQTLQLGVDSPEGFFDVPVTSDTPKRVAGAGCGFPTLNMNFYPKDGLVSIPLNSTVNLEGKKSCIFDGFVFGGGDDVTFAGLYSRYADNFSPLPIPQVIWDEARKSLSVAASPVVSIITLDDRVSISSGVRFKNADPGESHIVRLYTSKGRSAIGEWNPQERTWLWMN